MCSGLYNNLSSSFLRGRVLLDHSEIDGRSRNRTSHRLQGVAVLRTMRAQHNRTQLTIARNSLQLVPIVRHRVRPKLLEQMSKKGGVRHDGDALLGPLVEPLKKQQRSLTTVLVRLALICIEDVFIVLHLAKVKARELGHDHPDGAPPVTDILAPPLPTLLANQNVRPRYCPRGLEGTFGRAIRSLPWIQECRHTRGARGAKDCLCRFKRPRHW
mmetsp:Transcript_17645/g.23779  ORF Transcript_17645/g.23779 Transcript_17645/m.23779 type:complete len:214 (-) Transcript_17645:210-851(-)